MSHRDPARDLADAVKGSWHRFVADFEPLRPELYRYCRHLTRSPWDAEDLVQDALARAFVTLGRLHHDPPPNPRAWLFRVASNLWIDRMRQRRQIPEARETHGDGEITQDVDPRELREAAGTLLAQLSPQERVAVVLKDAFDLSLEEIAEVLSTTVGAIKAALHRGRGRLMSPEGANRQTPVPETLDAFCAAFNARDVARMTSLLLGSSVLELVGVATDYGPEQALERQHGSLAGMLAPIVRDERGGVDPRFLEDYVATQPRVEARMHRGIPILLHWYGHTGGDAVRAISRVVLDADQIGRVANYFFAPEVIAEVCQELQVPFRTNGYRYW